MNIIGKLVTLRAIELSDCEMLRSLMNDPEIEYMLGGWSFPVSTDEQEQWCQNLSASKDTLRVIIEAESTTIGTAVLSDIDYKNGTAQIHIKLMPGDNRHKGYGSDTVNTLVRYAFHELRLHCVYAHVNEHNEPSQRLFHKCGFQQEGILRDRIYKDGRYIGIIVLSRLNLSGESYE